MHGGSNKAKGVSSVSLLHIWKVVKWHNVHESYLYKGFYGAARFAVHLPIYAIKTWEYSSIIKIQLVVLSTNK